jgi:hypothetical protein
VRNESRKRIQEKVKSSCREKERNMGKDGKVKERKDRCTYQKGK